MSLLERLFAFQNNPASSITDYANIGPTDGGAPWGIADPTYKTIQIGQKKKIQNLSAAYTAVGADSGTFFTVDTAVTFTLPAASAALVGVFYEVAVIADVIVVIAATNASELIIFNDTAANSFTWSTSSEKTGAACRLTCVSSTKWLVTLWTEETQTTTVTT